MQDKIHQILEKGKSEGSTDVEKNEMFSLFHQAEHEYELKGILLQELNDTETDNVHAPFFKRLFKKLWAKIEKKNKESRNNIRFIRTLGKVAAAVVIGLFIGMYVSSQKNLQEPAYYSANSPKGSVSQMQMPDGTIIFLNAGSEIQYNCNGDDGTREVHLDGEAWFDVSKNKKKPFIVHTQCYDVKVTGTQFNVKSYREDNEVVTTLEEGEIIISGTENYKLAENITVKPGEQVSLNKSTKNITVKKVNTNWYTSWKDNKLIFVNTRMEEFLVLLERKYGVDIEIDNQEEILDLHIDITVKNETIIELLDLMKEMLPIDYKIIDQKIKIIAN